MKPEKLLLRTGSKRFRFYKIDMCCWLKVLKVTVHAKQFLLSFNRVIVEGVNKNVYMEHFCKFPIYIVFIV